MRESLYIRWHADTESDLTYTLVDPEAPNSIVSERAALDELSRLAQGRRVILLVTDNQVQLTHASFPTGQTQKFLQALPWLLEDQLAEDVETLHFAIGKRRTDGLCPVAVAAKTDMEAWLTPFRERGIEVHVVVPQILCLPQPQAGSAWPVLLEGTRVSVRHTAFSGFSCPPEDLPLFLQIAEGENGPHELEIWLTEDSSAQALETGTRELSLQPGYQDALQVLARHYSPATSINLLQGAYSKRANLKRLWQPWRLAAALVVAVFVVAWLTNVIQAVRIGDQADAQQVANAQRFHRLFPNQPTSLALSLAIEQVAANSATAGAYNSLLPLLRQTSAALSAIGGLQAQEVQYHDHALFVSLTGSDLRALDRLRHWFSQHPHTHLDVQDANASGNKVEVHIKVTAS